MSAIDTAKDILKTAMTAGMSGEVIGLLEKKIGLITDQVTTLEQENASLKTENANFQRQAAELQSQLAQLAPDGEELDEAKVKILRYLFQNGETALEYVAQRIGLPTGTIEYHRDALADAGFMQQTGMTVSGMGADTLGAYDIMPKGRKYLVERSLV
jgi:FtsZ-binding cell division protein ZapB